jgi:aminopeptidase
LTDPRVAEHAKILVNYSCQVKKGDFVLIQGSDQALPLLRAAAAEIGRAGAHFLVNFQDASINRAFLLAADDDTIEAYPSQKLELFKTCDVFINIISSSNVFASSDVPAEKMKLATKSNALIFPLLQTKRWCITLHPTPALAQEAHKSLEAYSDFVYGATLRDWQKMASEMQTLAEKFAKAKTVKIVGKDTDISFSIEGRKPIVDDGKQNLPGGEVFVSPVESTVNGTVYFDFPVMYFGREVSGVRLRFKNGEVVDSSAEQGEEVLREIISTDEGARRLGELGIGMNRGIKDFSKNMLFDEKLGDTIHMALGQAIEESGGTNKSAVHVDILKRMKVGGAIYFGDEAIYKDGKFSWE